MPDSKETQILINDARKGDEQAARRLLVLYHPRLRARLLRQMDPVMRSKIEPEDILQQVYFEAFRAIQQFTYQGKDSFLRWMYAILDRKLIDEHRALRAERRDVRREVKAAPASVNQTTYVDLMARVMAESGTPSKVIRKDEALGVISACVATLPDHYRDVIQMRFLEGLPVAEVAEKLDRSIGSVHMICHRALRQLREQAEKLGVTRDD
ncbi:MAG: sigma-70 family RNA polymerase sigma factor [Phycisphaerales bacterium]|nr:sigma-70 family RNA polymerase sigma factor [Phycisphaerales bacterium]